MYKFYKSWIYRLWVIGGLLAVVGVVLYVGLNTKPGDPPPYGVIGGAVGIYLVGLILLQALGLVLARPDQGGAPLHAGAITADPSRAPATPEELAELLAVHQADGTGSRKRAERDAYRFAWAQWLPIAAIAILLPLAGFLWITGAVPQVWQPFGPTGIGIPVAAIPGLIIVLVLFLLLPWTMRRAKKISDDYHAPLGLRISRTPGIILLPRVGTDGIGAHTVGPTTFSGSRHGREVVVDAYAGRSAVLVTQPGPVYRLDGRNDRLQPQGGPVPPAHAELIATLAADDRFNAIRVESGPAGIRVDRRGASVNQDWLFDIWLAERLAAIG